MTILSGEHFCGNFYMHKPTTRAEKVSALQSVEKVFKYIRRNQQTRLQSHISMLFESAKWIQRHAEGGENIRPLPQNANNKKLNLTR
jgi:hypothetical protein